ncbi:MAG: fused MFS/spermidine synthase [Rhodospirillales bacterium]|nr:fused MFS/spermidine synthase [Alphaproteobacteria bacterium]USO03047.1 MAG: fused MFS/spermidine synthase [Rhodospirillales bacterium]
MTTQKTLPYLFAFTLFLSAALLFSVQPMLGKMMLPHVGGAPSGWVVAMFFFQTCLLAGYGLAYLFSKLPPFLNILTVLILFIPGALFLPISYHGGITDSISPASVFVQLTFSAAVPFMTLSTLAPGLQRLFSFSKHATAGDPYYLYAASNLGSFVGLLAYPALLEPLIGLEMQSHIWMLLYALLAFSVGLCGLAVFKKARNLISLKIRDRAVKTETHLETHQDSKPLTWKRRFFWLILAALPSSLMLGVTTEITTDIASVPMIWVIPLGLYLLTNIIAFSRRRTINLKLLSALHMLGIALITFHITMKLDFSYSLLMSVLVTVLYLSVFTLTALILHSRLANDRPETNRLTEFYLILALGGAMGGGFNAFIAPVIFNNVYEFQAVLLLSLILNPAFHEKTPPALSRMLKVIVALALLCVALTFLTQTVFVYIALVLLIFFATIHARTLFLVCALVLTSLSLHNSEYLHIGRNFFGVTKVYEGYLDKAETTPVLKFMHGTTLHGFQAKDKAVAHNPTGYYSTKGPVGDVLAITNPKDIAVLGLGTGQLACQRKKGRDFTFYDIDPQVIEIATSYFSHLEECGYKEIIEGDARLELMKQDKIYDAIFVDTFSSDSIPVHIITKEAVDLYFSRLKEGGAITIHITNRHLDLRTPLAATAKKEGYFYRFKRYDKQTENPYDLSSSWVVLTRNREIVRRLDQRGWEGMDTDSRPWTDDYSNLLSTLKILNPAKEKRD